MKQSGQTFDWNMYVWGYVNYKEINYTFKNFKVPNLFMLFCLIQRAFIDVQICTLTNHSNINHLVRVLLHFFAMFKFNLAVVIW